MMGETKRKMERRGGWKEIIKEGGMKEKWEKGKKIRRNQNKSWNNYYQFNLMIYNGQQLINKRWLNKLFLLAFSRCYCYFNFDYRKISNTGYYK